MNISIPVIDFEHLLNCLANQKFINEQKPETHQEWQGVIDKAWRKGMGLLSKSREVKTP